MECEFIDWLREQLTTGDALRVGVGDDAAVVRWRQNRDLVVTTDLLIDRVHFDLSTGVDARRVGRKALAVNLSDLAAMAAQPVGAVISLALPRTDGLALAKSLYEGLIPLARQFNCLIVGGDTNSHDGPPVISVTAFGQPMGGQVWTRSGAKPGDHLLVTGRLGGSLLGRHLDFEPRVNEARALASSYSIHAAMDVSDGLAMDLARLVKESHCGAILREAELPIAEAAYEAAQTSGRTAVGHALSDGEDFELLMAVPPATAARLIAEQPLDIEITDIGVITAERTRTIIGADGQVHSLESRGYEHTFDS